MGKLIECLDSVAGTNFVAYNGDAIPISEIQICPMKIADAGRIWDLNMKGGFHSCGRNLY